METTTEELVVPARFCGPTSSGNGGWTSGAVAGLVEACPTDHARTWPTVEVTLRRPPPLDAPLRVSSTGDLTVVEDDDGRVAEARAVDRAIDPVGPVPADEARAAEASYAGFAEHPFPRCFVCGPGRDEGDGLRIFPGRVGEARVAATWTPHPSVAEDYHAYVDDERRAAAPVTWAAMDCVGGWTGDLLGRPMVLGRMTAQLLSLPHIGEEHVVVGEWRGAEGRKMSTAATLYDSAGREVARAEHVWIAVDVAKFG
jgi:hypothetical protein